MVLLEKLFIFHPINRLKMESYINDITRFLLYYPNNVHQKVMGYIFAFKSKGKPVINKKTIRGRCKENRGEIVDIRQCETEANTNKRSPFLYYFIHPYRCIITGFSS